MGPLRALQKSRADENLEGAGEQAEPTVNLSEQEALFSLPTHLEWISPVVGEIVWIHRPGFLCLTNK